MGLSELRKMIRDRQKMEEQSAVEREDSPELKALITKCRGLPFWIWGRDKYHTEPIDLKDIPIPNKRCCFVHQIGLPEKSGRKHIMYDYEQELFKYLEIPTYANTRKSNDTDLEYFNQLRVEAEKKAGMKKGDGSVNKAESDYLKKRQVKCIIKRCLMLPASNQPV